MQTTGFDLRPVLGLLFFFLSIESGWAQQVPTPMPGAPVTLQNAPQRDTSNKTNTNTWKSEDAIVWFRKLNSERKHHPDTGLHTFHRRPFSQPWHRDLGNLGSPSRSLLFEPEDRTGPTLGYHAFDVYRFHPDSLSYYNTTRPYTEFIYNLGSKAEQLASVLHTQNVTPTWNFAANYRKVGSPGYYRNQRTSHDLASLTTNYQSRNQHYKLFGAAVYNKLQHDENGGIIEEILLEDEDFSDRMTIPVRFVDDGYSQRRSPVSTMLRDFALTINHAYTWGRTDTTYSADSTSYSFQLKPRFSISHRLGIRSEKYQYKDVRPDSLRYTGLFERTFSPGDSVYMDQRWTMVDNAFLLNGFVGASEDPMTFSAGFGVRFDRFRTEYIIGDAREDIFSNYLTGEIRKEALEAGKWFYDASARLFLTGNAAGNFRLTANLGKDISSAIGNISLGFDQRLNNAPYNFTIYKHAYYERYGSFNDKESITLLSATLRNEKFEASAGLRNYTIANYYYLNQQQEFSQFTSAFNLTQIWLNKVFRFGILVLDNEFAYQQKTADAPINVPVLMGRHQLSIETWLFGNALKIATGIDVRWHTPYEPSGYAPFFNRFYYQDSYSVTNAPETAVFFNFKIKRFRAYVMGDQLQQMITRNVISAPGYPMQDAMIRFGFNWVMIN